MRTHRNAEFLIAGRIMNKNIKLINDIHVGLKTDEFTSRFSDSLTIKEDQIEMIGEGTKYTFIFKKDKLYKISIENYID